MVEIRSLTVDDLASLVAFYTQQTSSVPYTPKLTVDMFTRRVLQHPLFDPEDLILAIDAKELAGLCHVGFWPKPSKTTQKTAWLGPYWEFGAIVNLLFPAGASEIGAQLIGSAEDRARKKGRTCAGQVYFSGGFCI